MPCLKDNQERLEIGEDSGSFSEGDLWSVHNEAAARRVVVGPW
jgi:hypothetical protein